MNIAEYGNEQIADIRVPRPLNHHNILHRPRLVELIEQAAAAPLCIVRGPRRSGKSVAVQQWSVETDKTVAWLHLDESYPEVERFWQQMHFAISSHLRQTTIPIDATLFAADPVRQLATLLEGVPPLTLILEDFRGISGSDGSAVEAQLIDLLDRTHELSLLIVTLLPLEIEQLHITSNIDIALIAREQLMFTDHEAGEFHRDSSLETLSTELNDRIHGVPELHRAAIRAAATPRNPSLPLVEDIVRKIGVMLQVTAAKKGHRTSPNTVGFLSTTLPLKQFDVALATHVAPELDVAAALRELSELGIMWTTVTGEQTHYSYPEFAREIHAGFLKVPDETHTSQVLQAAAHFQSGRGECVSAFNFAIKSGDYRLASNMLLRSGLLVLFQSGTGLTEALKTIPHLQLVKYPLLCIVLGIIHIGKKRTRLKALEYFMLALTSAKLQGKSLHAEDKLAINLVQAVALRLTGQFKLAASTSRSAMKDLKEMPLANRDELGIFESIAAGHWGLCQLFVGDYAGATTALHHAVAVGEKFNAHQESFFAESLLAYRYAVDGDLKTAAEYAATAADSWPDMPAVELYQQTPLNMALALIELGKLNVDSAAAHLDKVISETSTSEFWGQLRVIEARIELLRGHAGHASGRLEILMQNSSELPALNPMDAIELATVRAELLMAGSNASGAQAVLSKLPAKSVARKVGQGRLALGMERYAEVVELLSGSLRYTSVRQAVSAQVLLTVARLHLQPISSARTDIERLSSSISTLGNKWPLALLSAQDLSLLMKAADELQVPLPAITLAARSVLPDSLSLITLTPREKLILATLVETGDRAEIARRHYVSLNTVKSQLRTLYRKLDVTSREEALLIAQQEHLL